jgi:hypothetical protein
MLVGGSSGSAMQAALEVAKGCKGGERIVVILADSVRNYMSKFLDPAWMSANGLDGTPMAADFANTSADG